MHSHSGRPMPFSHNNNCFFSYFNRKEVAVVLEFVRKLLSFVNTKDLLDYRKTLTKITMNDIGIISPYRSQCRKITNACRNRGWANIKIGTLEMFQSQEKPIIIVSTVRSDDCNIDFICENVRNFSCDNCFVQIH